MYRVLVADDEPIERTVVSKTIQTYFPGQLEVVTAENGRQAAELFFSKNCDIALLDIEMPGVNGLEAAKQIRARDKYCSIIFLTAFDDFSYAKQAIGVKALEYLLKPGADEELLAVLEEAIRLAQEREGRADKTAETQEPENAAEDAGAWGEADWREVDCGLEENRSGNIRMNAVAENIRNYIERHYQDDISLQTAAHAMNYSDAYFCKIFKQCFDKSFIVYLSEYRVEKAKQLLADVVINVKDISRKVGYHDSNYFAKVFKRVAGMTPTEYRMHMLRDVKV